MQMSAPDLLGPIESNRDIKPLLVASQVSAKHREDSSSSSNESDSDNDQNETADHSTSARRKVQNVIFANYVSSRAAEVTKDEVEAAKKTEQDDELSIRALMSNQESRKIIDDPRDYQLELFEKAKQQNVIAVLDTGSGKTLIAVLLLKYVLDLELESRAQGKKPRIAFFLVDSVALVFQQFAVLECNLDQPIDRYCGEMNCDLWTPEKWRENFDQNKVIVCTAEILYQCLMHSFISMDEINMIIFDEAHHAKKNHPYARIMRDHYFRQSAATRPKLFSMTASPLDSLEDPVRAAKQLETILDSRILTASDMSLLQTVTKRPEEQLLVYDRLDYPYDTDLSQYMQCKYSHVGEFRRISEKAREISSELGTWCADVLWGMALADEEARKLEKRIEYQMNKEDRPIQILDHQIQQIREAEQYVASLPSSPLTLEKPCVSSKVLVLCQYLKLRYEKPTDHKCIVFVERRYMARVLLEFLKRVNIGHIHLGLIMGKRAGEAGDKKLSVKQQLLTLTRFRKGELNCLFATSVAEEGLDIPDCNLIIRFSLYTTLIQYIQSRGRARSLHSKYVHMIEKDNRRHLQSIRMVQEGEQKLKRFCEALPQDRLLQGDEADFETIAQEHASKRFTDPESGAVLTYHSSLTVLGHFVACLPHGPDMILQATYHVFAENKRFVCEVTLPEISPLRFSIGCAAARKCVAKQAAAFEACCHLRKMGHIDRNLLPTYHKQLPKMRNAHLAIDSKTKAVYNMKIKPTVWGEGRGTSPENLYITIMELEQPEKLGRACQPMALLTRKPMPQFPSFLLHLQPAKASNAICTSIPTSFHVSDSDLHSLNEFSLRIYMDIFNKTFESNIPQMSYWLAPIRPNWKMLHHLQSPKQLIEWSIVKYVSDTPEIPWNMETPHSQLLDKYLVDRWDGGRRFFSIAVDPILKPESPVPDGVAPHKSMDNILNYTISLFKKSRERSSWSPNQPVIQAERILHRINWLDEYTDKERHVRTKSFVCPEPLKFSALPLSTVTMGYIFPAILTRLESYLVSLEAFSSLGLVVHPSLALEAMTKDSDNTEEHRSEQIHVQRGMGKNYERLEFIGDCFLKMATSISLFIKSPDDNEFEYHVKRMLMICNQNLFRTAKERKIYEHIRSQGFSRRTWYPEGIKLLVGKGHNKTTAETLKHHLGDKSIADVCEAMIGASLLSYQETGDVDMAVKAVTILVSSDDHNITKWAHYYASYEPPKYQFAPATASQCDLVKQIEHKLGYHFESPRLLRSAFIHPSYSFAIEKIPCYQRLEFLGDSLLDMACVNFLYYRYPDKDPQWLTEHKMAMVSNKFQAALSVKLGFHKHLRSNGTVIEAANREYVTETMDAEYEASGAPDYWTTTKQPPKALSDVVESYVGALFVDSQFDFGQVEKFFEKHIRPFFEDMTIYDTFANNHPTTYLHNLLSQNFSCHNYRLMSCELPSCIPGAPSKTIAVLMVHDQVVAEGTASSGKNAKVKASARATEELKGLVLYEYQNRFRCDCSMETKGAALVTAQYAPRAENANVDSAI
ncbi:uncharacterized protein KY384_007811 [Bacidia gigantensis]|uniref:uncharacterized protein n=1 Tax=Bacidia gigantensis TaxID=2732470 RepID=UPI001D058F40|nr:uncharacterized protein KY384_007811 [Bacidia gigantensis]KAG8527658.1 hypothetical protein KY384_007811 [Bacidia gigantensis]